MLGQGESARPARARRTRRPHKLRLKRLWAEFFSLGRPWRFELLKKELELLRIELLALFAEESAREPIELHFERYDLLLCLRELAIPLREERIARGQLLEELSFARVVHESARRLAKKVIK
jgi:hypothetical protein